MKIQSILIRGFRCFSDEGQRIELNDLTCLVGPNASGKTATMAALARMFGETQADRTIRSTDFHLAPGNNLNDQATRQITLEAILVFPELDGEAELAGDTVPEGFNQMVIDAPQATPYCRVRLDATWEDDGTSAGDIQQKLTWITTASNDPEVVEENKRTVKPAERARIRVLYIPATRDPSSQIKATTASAFGRLLRAIDWSGRDEQLRLRLAELKSELGQLPGIGTMNTNVQGSWSKLYDGRVAANIAFESVDADPKALLNLLAPAFSPNEQGQSVPYTELSDGLRSLFALSLPLGLYCVEELLKADAAASGFQGAVADDLPLLTLFAVEEPENHLSPHYLGKVITHLLEISRSATAQVVLSSHSPSIMARVEPDDVRYFLGGEMRASTTVRGLTLPTDGEDEAFKYVREAVRGYSELYFSRLVILGEGPSEEIVLRKLFESSGTPLDAHFVSVVPLGGRHVNHLWRLLNGLGISYITLLDLDSEKEGAGWGRVQYIRDQLLKLHGSEAPYLRFEDANGATHSLSDETYDTLHEKDVYTAAAELQWWLTHFRLKFDVFFSAPLDLDLAMLECFPDAYKNQTPAGGGPRLPVAEPQRGDAVRARMRQVLTSDPASAPAQLGATYTAAQVELFPWYKYLFVDGSKPVAHMRALVALDGTPWTTTAPATLRLLLEKARELVSPQRPVA